VSQADCWMDRGGAVSPGPASSNMPSARLESSPPRRLHAPLAAHLELDACRSRALHPRSGRRDGGPHRIDLCELLLLCLETRPLAGRASTQVLRVLPAMGSSRGSHRPGLTTLAIPQKLVTQARLPPCVAHGREVEPRRTAAIAQLSGLAGRAMASRCGWCGSGRQRPA
jgi:hypothetical protein